MNAHVDLCLLTLFRDFKNINFFLASARLGRISSTGSVLPAGAVALMFVLTALLLECLKFDSDSTCLREPAEAWVLAPRPPPDIDFELGWVGNVGVM